MDEKEMQDVLNHLSVLEPTERDRPQSATQAYQQIQRQLRPATQRPSPLTTFFNALFSQPNRRWATTAVAFLFIFAVLFSSPAVRAAASDFLSQFRVQKFAAISVSPEQVAMLQQLADEGVVPGSLEITDEPDTPKLVNTLGEASLLTGFPSRTLPDKGDPAAIYMAGGGNGRFTIDLAGSRAIMEAVGADPTLLADELDGEIVNIAVYPSTEQRWTDGTSLIQTASPLVEYPEGFDQNLLAEASLQVLGLSDAESARLSRSIDWTSTLLLPIPQEAATFSEVMVDGVSGMALTSLDGTTTALIWQKEGQVYILTGADSVQNLVSTAAQLR